MRNLAALAALSLTLGLAACAGDDTQTGPMMTQRPELKATCTLGAGSDSRAYDSGYGVVSLKDSQKVVVIGATQDEIRERLNKLGVGTKDHPCETITVDHLNGEAQ